MKNLTNIRLLIEFLDNKRCREILCTNYVIENPLMTEKIINYWNLNRIDQKYRRKTRLFNENSYSKRKIKEEEIMFVRKHALFQPLRYYFEEQRKLHDDLFVGLEAHENFNVDDEIYIGTIIRRENYCDFPKHPFIVKKNNRARIDLTNDLLEIAEIRERCIDEYLIENSEFLTYVIDKYKLKFIKYKYINHSISKYESSYTRQKIKVEEMFLLNKVYQFSVWFRRMEVFWDLQQSLFVEQLIEKETKNLKQNNEFIKLIVEQIISEYREADFDLADDINLN